MPRIQYRVGAKVSDQQLNRLFRAAWDDHDDREFADVLECSLGYVCAYKESRLVGFVNVAWDGGVHGFLLDTTVHPSCQHRGVGRKLVKIAIEIANNAELHWLHVDYEPDLAEFYQACGFRHTPAGLLNLRDPGAISEIASVSESPPSGLPMVLSLAITNAVVGLDVGAVFATVPTAVAVARWACPLAALVGLVLGVSFGRTFNQMFHFRGGQKFWPLFGGLAAAAAGAWLVALGFALVGSVAGWLVGWLMASFLLGKRRLVVPLLSMAGGCFAQAVWLDSWPALRFAALGAGIGVLSAPVIRIVYMVLGPLLLTFEPPGGEEEADDNDNG
jgi:GNAT superfamily N-acetyltransferase